MYNPIFQLQKCQLPTYNNSVLVWLTVIQFDHQIILILQLNIMNQLNLTHDKLAPILSSIAQTYQDIKRYDDAINFYCQEVKIQKQLDNQDQVGNTSACFFFFFWTARW